MKSKTLEILLATESGLYSDMVTRFQKLRENLRISRGRGRNAEFLSTSEVVWGILSVVANKPAYAAVAAGGLHNLRPVGLAADAFAGASTLGAALAAALDDPALLMTVKKIHLGDSHPVSGMATSAAIKYREGDVERESQYVPGTALSLFHKGAEVGFDRHSLNLDLSIAQERVIEPRLLVRIARELTEAKQLREREDEPAQA